MSGWTHPLGDERGSVFWAVLAVLLTVSLLFASVVFYGTWHQAQNRRFLYRQQAKYLALAAVEHTRWKLEHLRRQSEPIPGLVIGDTLPGKQSWQSDLQPWGCYWRAVCRGQSHHEQWTADVLLGSDPARDFGQAVRLFGPPYPLVVAGTTRITGDVAIGPGGVSAGRYQGRSFLDTILVHGTITTDPALTRPRFDFTVWEDFESHLQAVKQRATMRSDRTLIIDDDFQLADEDSLVFIDGEVAFARTRPLPAGNPVYVIATGDISVTGSTRMVGRWVIASERRIEIKDSAHLAGVILCAPAITCADASSFSGQAIADTLLELKENARTVFPTVLWVKGKNGSAAGSLLDLSGTAECAGIALATTNPSQWGVSSEHQGKAELRLGNKATWIGYLYADGRAQLQGTLFGSVVANLLYLDDPPTTYLNWLVDCRIDRTAWRGRAGLPIFFAEESPLITAEVMPLRSKP